MQCDLDDSLCCAVLCAVSLFHVFCHHAQGTHSSLRAMSCCVLCHRKREYKIKNLDAENAKIAAKEKSEGGLTQGQASTLVSGVRGCNSC